MKTMFRLVYVLAILGGLVLAGCAKKDVLSTSALESSFKAADADLKGAVDKVVAAVKSADYKGAISELESLAKNTKLTADQKQAVSDMVGKVQKFIADAAAKAGSEAGKAVDSATKALSK